MFIGSKRSLLYRQTTSATSTWSPSSLFASAQPGCIFDASNTESVKQDDAGTTPGVVDSPVGRWVDQSPNAKHVTKTLTARPTWRSSGGLYWLEFDALDDRLDGGVLSDLISASVGEVIISLRATSVTLDNANVFGNHKVWTDDNIVQGIAIRVGSIAYGYSWDGAVDAASTTYTANTDAVLCWRHFGGNVGIASGTAAYTEVASGDATLLSGTFQIGRDYAGRVYRMIVRGGASVMTDSERASAVAWCAAGYGG